MDEALALDEPSEAAPSTPSSLGEVEVEIEFEEAASTPPLEPPAEAPPEVPAPARALPPGLRRRTGEFPAVSVPPPPPPEDAAPRPPPLRGASTAGSSERLERFVPDEGVDFESPVPGSTPFTELAGEADSLLHAVEMAALAGAEQPEPEPADDAILEEGEESIAQAPVLEGALPEIPLFSDLPREAFIALFERCPLRRFAEGERILEQGSQGNAFYVICAGRVRIVRQSGQEQRELAVLEEGAFFGEMALLSGAPRSASVVSAAEETQVLEISAPVLASLSRRHPQVARALRRFCRQRLLSQVVNSSALFLPFGRKDRRALVERFRAREVRRGDAIIHEGQPVDGLYVVLSGEVAVSKEGQRPGAAERGRAVRGDVAAATRRPPRRRVTAVRNTSLLRLPREDFDTLILTHPQILVLISELTDARQRSNDARLGGGPPAPDGPAEGFEDLVLFWTAVSSGPAQPLSGDGESRYV